MMRRKVGFLSKLVEHFGGCIGALVQIATVAAALVFAANIKHH